MNNKRVFFGWGGSLAILLVIIGCTTAPITGRRQLSLISAGEEMQLGLSEFEKMKKDTPISRDPALNEMVQRVGKRVAAASGDHLPNAQWEFVVFESKEANAFCLPGGKVGVYTGLLPITKNEAGLATVIGHEVAHAAAHHGAERMSHAMAAQTGGSLLGVALSAADPRVQSLVSMAYPAVAQVGVMLPYGRKQESEADQVGLIYMAKAGYDPEEAVHFWTRFSEFNNAAGRSSGGLAIFRTHPVDSVRIANLKKWMPEAKAHYRPQQ
ncbi:MAG: M48 family metallopeptidase [Verrucomicrobiales bacterium]